MNERDTTQKDAPLLNLTTAIKSIVTPIQDYLKTSKKENFVVMKDHMVILVLVYQKK